MSHNPDADDLRTLRAQVVVVGSINADLVTLVAKHPNPGETVLGSGLTVLPGGKGANQAVAAARLGSRVALVGAVGDDQFADAALAGLREANVDLGALDTVPGPTGIALITVAADGENTIVVVPGANSALDQDGVDRHRELIGSAPIVVACAEIPAEAIAATAQLTRGRLVFNLAPVIPLDPDILRAADPLIVNEHEGRLAAGLLGGNAQGDGGGSDEAVVEALVAAGVRAVVMTRGARGALVATQAGTVSVPSPQVQAVDTTGAGDAFVGALAHRLAAGDDLVGAARYAARVGAYAVGAPGAQPSYPHPEHVLPEVQ